MFRSEMFTGGKRSSQDLKKCTNKFLDHKRDTHQRLRNLKTLLDAHTDFDVKALFEKHPVEVFYVFYEEFTNFEATAKSKGHTKAKEDLEFLLSILENILIFLPDKIYQRWQFNSIGLILRKLLHHGNILSIREMAIRLFMLWLQILQEKVDELALLVYASVVPGFPSVIHKVDLEALNLPKRNIEYIIASISGVGHNTAHNVFNTSFENEAEWCIMEGCGPILPPQAGEKNPSPEELTKKFLDRILDYMTRKMLDIQWSDKHNRESGFYHLLNHFKRFYLPYIFPLWKPDDRIYGNEEDLSQTMYVPLTDPKETVTNNSPLMLTCRRAVLCWLIAFTSRLKHRAGIYSKSEGQSFDSANALSETSNDATDGNVESPSQEGPPSPSHPMSKNKFEVLCEVADIVRSVLYSTKENVLMVLEILRQSFLMPLAYSDTMSHVLSVYHDWLKSEERPEFMLEPKKMQRPIFMLEPEPDSSGSILVGDSELDLASPVIRSPSYKEAVRSSEKTFFAKLPVECVRAGFQPNVRAFIVFSAQVFFSKSDKEFQTKHVDICRKVIKMYRAIVLEMRLDSLTWNQLLAVLLKITGYLMKERPPEQRMSTLGGQLATYFLQTLFVTWIRASLQVYLKPELWNECMVVLASVTSWDEVITEWSNTMNTLTRVMARTVYLIDLNDPPLSKLSEQKQLRIRGREQIKLSATDKDSRQSFAQSLSRYEKQAQPMLDHGKESAGVVSGASVERPDLIRSTSEPTMAKVDDDCRRVTSQVSDSVLLGTSDQDVSTKVMSIDLGPEDENDTNTTPKRRLASLAQSANLVSQESVTSYASVFESIPAIDVDSDSDVESIGERNVRYEKLRDPDSVSNISNTSSLQVIMPESMSLGSLNSYLSESSQNLLANGDSNTSMEDEFNTNGANLALSPDDQQNQTFSDSLQDSTSVSGSISESLGVPGIGFSKFLRRNRGSCDLINFEEDVIKQKFSAADAQSIDSSMFVAIDSENFSDTAKSSLNAFPSNITESQEEEQIDDVLDSDDIPTTTSSHKVRFSNEYDQEEEEEKDADETIVNAASRSVIEGGTQEGWTPLSSVILWRRVLGLIGNVNKIKSSEMHGKVFKQLIHIWTELETVKRNQGISLDNKVTPLPPELTPPLFFAATWCFQAMAQPMAIEHKPGRVLAYKLICMMTIKNHGIRPSDLHMIHFYRLLHAGLTGSDQDVINAIISQCAPFYSSGFESASSLMLDFIHATNTIISTQYMQYPRKEALTLLGSMLCLPYQYGTMPIHQPGLRTNEYEAVTDGDGLREKLLTPILKAARSDPSCRARCVALNSLGLFIIESLIHLKGHPKIHDCLTLIVSSLEFHSRIVSNVALDVLWTLSFYHVELAAFDPELPLKIVESMCHLSMLLHGDTRSSSSDPPADDTPEYLSRILLVILEWVMVIPRDVMLQSRLEREDSFTYLGLAFKTFQQATEAKQSHRVTVLERRRSLNVNHIFMGESRPIRLARVHNDLSMDDEQGITDEDDETDLLANANEENRSLVLSLTATYCIMQLHNFYQHFPFNTGAVRPVSLVGEADDGAFGDLEEMSSKVFGYGNIQFLLLNESIMVTLVELPQQIEQSFGIFCSKTISRLIIRDMSGKYCWDVTDLNTALKSDIDQVSSDIESNRSAMRRHSRNLSVSTIRAFSSCSSALPSWESIEAGADCVDQLLRYIGESSPECLLYDDKPLNVPAPVPERLQMPVQQSAVTSVLKQQNEEENYVHEIGRDKRIMAHKISPPTYEEPSSIFHVSRRLLHNLGYLSWKKRVDIELLNTTDRLLSDIKHLDNRSSRETQKIAVFYVAPGQEDKQSILMNTCGSKRFEEFLSGMAWEVDLSTHTGFMGGLESNQSTGATAPYFATHSLEVVFHVSTRIPGSDEEKLKTKLRHLGNDEVHIVWSDHSRDFRRGIINTDFADAMIMIYPLANNLFRIQIDKNPKIPPFGPLFDGAIVNWDLLPLLVRSTAINAGRAKRRTIPLYEMHFQERAHYLRNIAKHRVRPSTFEEYSGKLFSPAMKHQDRIESDSSYKTSSLSSNRNSDPTIPNLRLLDMPDSIRPRTSSAVMSRADKPRRTTSNQSLNLMTQIGEDSLSVLDREKEAKDRRKSLVKRPKKKQTSVDIGEA